MTRAEARERLAALCKAPPAGVGVERTRMWVAARKRAIRYRNPQLRTALREIAALEAVATVPLPLPLPLPLFDGPQP